jgi:exodeoxyribonuclease VII small subunit
MADHGAGRRGSARSNGAGKAGGESAGDGQVRQDPASLPAFDEALSQLEETVRALESGGLALDEALDVFERGVRLAQVCQAVLDHAALRVRQLVPADDDADTMTVESLEIDLD